MEWQQVQQRATVLHDYPQTENAKLQVLEGQQVTVIARNQSWALVIHDDITTDAAVTDDADLVPLKSLRVLSGESSVATGFNSESNRQWSANQTVRGIDDVTGVERVARSWRSNLRKALARGDREGFDKVHNQLSQLGEWKRQKSVVDSTAGGVQSTSRLANAVNDSIARLVESSSQVRAGLVTPRTCRDEPATEANMGVMQLLRVHMETEARLAGGVRVPASASESLSAEVAKGTHGGPSVPNERATDVSGLSMGGKRGSTPLSLLADALSQSDTDSSLAFVSTRLMAHNLLQFVLEVDLCVALGGGGQGGSGGASGPPLTDAGMGGGSPATSSPSTGLQQPSELYLSLWDAATGVWLGEEVVVHADARGKTVVAGSGGRRALGTGTGGWSQALFVNVPRAAALAGRLYVVLRLFRRGPLKEVGTSPGPTPISSDRTPSLDAYGRDMLGVPGGAPDRASIAGTVRSILYRGREPDAIYRRPVGVAIVLIPPALLHLADGTPHRPSDPVVLVRPAKADESRFFGLHRVLVSERERDAEQDGRRKGLGTGATVGAALGSPPNEAGAGGGGAGLSSSTGTNNSVSTGPGSTAVSTAKLSESASVAPPLHGTGGTPWVRVGTVGPLPVIVRAFSGLPMAVLRDPRYAQLFSPQTLAGSTLALPTAYIWRPGSGSVSKGVGSTKAGVLAHASGTATASGSVGRRARMVRQSSASALQGSPSPCPPLGGEDECVPAAEQGAVDVTAPALSGLHLLTGPHKPRDIPVHCVHRDVLYVTLRSGSFAQDKKMTQRNIQVRVHVVLDTGAGLPCLLRAVHSGLTAPTSAAGVGLVADKEGPRLPLSSEWRSAVYYHCNTPVFDETLAVHIPCNAQFERAHLRLSFWHASSNDAKTHPFSFTFLPLACSSGAAIRDGLHVLRCYTPPEYREDDPMTAATHRDGAGKVVKDKDGNVPPWYLVSAMVDAQGALASPATPLPSDAPLAMQGGGWAKPPLSTNVHCGLSASHAAAARSRRLPISAVPVPLAEQYPSVPLPAGLVRSISKLGASTYLGTGIGSGRGADEGMGLEGTPAVPSRGVAGMSDDGPWSPVTGHGRGGSGGRAAMDSPEKDAALHGEGGGEKSTNGTLPEQGQGAAGAAIQTANASTNSGATRVSEWHVRGRPYDPGPASMSIVAALGLAAGSGGRKYERMGAHVRRGGAGGAVTGGEPWDAFPLELRAKDVFEVETRLVSEYKSSTPEIHTLLGWRAQQPAPVYAALLHVQRMVSADPVSCVRHVSPLLSVCLDLLNTLLPQEGGQGQDTPPFIVAAAPRTRSGLLSASVRLLACVLSTVSSSVRPARAGGGEGEGAPLSSPSLLLARMAPPAVDSFACAHAIPALLAAGLVCPGGERAILRLLTVCARAIGAEPGGRLDLAGGGKVSVPVAHEKEDGEREGGARPDSLCLSLTVDTLHAVARSLCPLLDIARALLENSLVQGEEERMGGGGGSKALSSFRCEVISLLLSLLGSCTRSGPSLPPPAHWLLVVHCAVLRQLPDILAGLSRVLRPAECGMLLGLALSPLSPSTPPSLAVSQLLCVRSAVRLGLVEQAHAGGVCALSKVVPLLSAHLNASGVQRAIAVRVTSCLLAQRDRAVHALGGEGGQSGEGGVGGAFGRRSWTLALLLADLSAAVTGIVLGRPALGDCRHEASAPPHRITQHTPSSLSTRTLTARHERAWMVPEHRILLRAARQARLLIPVRDGDGEGRLAVARAVDGVIVHGAGHGEDMIPPSPPQQRSPMPVHRLQGSPVPVPQTPSRALSFLRPKQSSFVFSPPPAAVPRGSTHTGNPWEWDCRALPDAEHEEAFGPEEGVQGYAECQPGACFWDRFARLGAVSWMSMVWGVPDQSGPYLLAALSPVLHDLSGIGEGEGGSPDAALSLRLVHEHARLRLSLQLLHACQAFLAASPLPAPWLGLGQLLHTCIVRVHRWVAGLLASVYSGNAGDDAAYWRWPATSTDAGAGVSGLPSPSSASWSLALPVWTVWMDLSVALLTSPLFAPESLASGRRQAVVERYGDRRGEVCDTVRTVWGGALGQAGGGREREGGAAWLAGAFIAPQAVYLDTTGAAMLAALHRARGRGDGDVCTPGLCASLRLALAPHLVAPLLDLTHCVNPSVSCLARDAYLDLLRAELTVQAARKASWTAGTWSTLGLGSQGSALPEMERLTIDTIDVLAAHKGPSLVVAHILGSGPTSSSTQTIAAASPTPTQPTSQARLTSHSVKSAFIPPLQGKSGVGVGNRVAALIRAASTEGGVPQPTRFASAGSDKPRHRRPTLTIHSAYVPPQDNLLMQLFAPKKMLRRARSSTGAGGTLTLSMGGGAFRAASSSSSYPGPKTDILHAVQEGEEEGEGEGGGTSPSRSPGPSGVHAPSLVGAEDLLTQRSVVQFLGEIRTLYAMLSSVSKYPHTPEWEDERATAALALISYLRRTHRLDMHAKYVTFLTDLHTRLGHDAEAALAHLLHADVLTWEGGGGGGRPGRVLPAVRFGDRTVFPSQTVSARLESILSRAMTDLESAGCWEEATRMGEVLAARYEHSTCEYGKLAGVLRANAALYERMAVAARIHASYFAVSYSPSRAFPASVRGRTFLFRGAPGERLGDFEERLMSKWPGASKAPFRLRPAGGGAPASLAGGGGAKEAASPPVESDALLLFEGVMQDNAEDEEGYEEEGEEGEDAVPMELGFGGVNVVPSFPMPGEPLPGFPDWTREGGAGAGAGMRSPTPWRASAFIAEEGEGTPAPTLALSPPRIGAYATAPRSLGEALHSPVLSSPMAGSLAVSMCLPTAPSPYKEEGQAYMPGLIRKGREQAGARFFMHQRPFRKRATKSGSDYLDLWVSRTYLASADSFPTTHRRSHVTAGREVALNPVEVALAGLQDRTSALQDLIERAEAGSDRGADQAFSATLQGVVDAAVSGGLANYGPLLTGKFQATHPEIAEDLCRPGKGQLLQALRTTIADQVAMAGRGIRVHEVKCAPENVPLHEFLVRRYATLLAQLHEWGIREPATPLGDEW